MLQIAFPDRKFSQRNISKDVNKWGDIKKLKGFICKVATQYNIHSPSEWYHVTRQQIIDAGGEGILEYYGGLVNALVVLYPTKDWPPHPNKATQSPGYWNESSNIRIFMEEVREKYNIHSPQEWYEKISYQTLLLEGASTGLTKYKGIAGLLQVAYPETSWKEFRRPPGYWSSSENIKVRLVPWRNMILVN